MEMEQEDFLKEKEKIEKMPESDQKAYYMRWLETHSEKTTARVEVTLNYARILYREGAFRKVMEALMPIILNHHAYPYCEAMITCFNQMGLAVNCEAEYTLARHFFQMALEIAKEHQVTSVYAKEYNNIGLTYHDQHDFKSASREYAQGVQWLPDSPIQEIIGPMLYENWANVLIGQERWTEALEKYELALQYRGDEDEDVLSIGMVIFYKLGMQKEYQACKKKFFARIQKEVRDPLFYTMFLEYGIDADNETFLAEIYRYMNIYLEEHPGSESWKGRSISADFKYRRAQKERNLEAMLEALQLKTEAQAMGIEALEKKRLEALNEYISISEEKQQALEQAEAATVAKSQFLSNMSHDIRTPMNVIFGLSQLMEHDKNDPEKMGDHIQKLKFSSQHLLSLINDILDMSKIESGEVTLNREFINLADQAEQLKSIICPQAEEKQQHFFIRIHKLRHENLLGDAVRLRQILINLLSNSVKYTPDKGTITLDLTENYREGEKRSEFEFTVTDNGYGMSPEFVKHIFEPFTRAEDSTTNKIQGTGLGMAITKNIVEIMGGKISLESELGKGSCFTVTIPIEIDREALPAISAGNILLVVQEESLLQNAETVFQEAGIRFWSAKTVDRAEEILAEASADAVLLAGHYEQRELKDAVRRLKKAANTDEIVFCVDYDQTELTYEKLRSCGICKVVTRPVFLTELAAVLQQPVESTGDPGTASDTVLKGMNFLCAEDNTLNAEILEAILEIEGASCTIFADGRQLTERFKTVKPGEYDAILMDMQMPVMNGLEAARAIRKGDNPLGQTIPIIAMTANAFSSDIKDCLDAGMDAHLSKPLDIENLKRTLRSLMGQMFSGGGTTVYPKKTHLTIP